MQSKKKQILTLNELKSKIIKKVAITFELFSNAKKKKVRKQQKKS